jgi:non-heme chloroperoxidase
MSTITVKDGTTIFYKDWGSGPVVTFSHGWPLCSDAWDSQSDLAIREPLVAVLTGMK